MAEDLAKLVADDGSLAIDALASALSAPRHACASAALAPAGHSAPMPRARCPERYLARSRAEREMLSCLRLGDFPMRRYQQRGCGGSDISLARRMQCCYRSRTTGDRYACRKVCGRTDAAVRRTVTRPRCVRASDGCAFRASADTAYCHAVTAAAQAENLARSWALPSAPRLPHHCCSTVRRWCGGGFAVRNLRRSAGEGRDDMWGKRAAMSHRFIQDSLPPRYRFPGG